jgi:hypothetical protein
MNWLIIGLVTILLMFVYISSKTWGMKRIVASNGKVYLVQEHAPGDARQAAEQLARLEAKLTAFVEYLKTSEKYKHDPRVRNIVKRWAGRLSEVNSMTTLDAAYSLNKREISVCIRDVDGKLQDDQTSMFVLLHEFGHLAVDNYGHGDEFWTAFRFILKIAIEDAKVYEDQNFEDFPQTYCEHKIRSSPYTCLKNDNCSL